jgi:hypothetical protein
MNLKVGDPVIVYKPIWMNKVHKNGYVNEIFELDGIMVYRVYFYDEGGRWVSSCNIFTHSNYFSHQGETIKLDVETERDLKLKDLGI